MSDDTQPAPNPSAVPTFPTVDFRSFLFEGFLTERQSPLRRNPP